jgi:hypothetical protein
MEDMRQVIGGKAYDTKTADELASATAGLSTSDPKHWFEKLYRTKEGAYFLAGQGGPMTRWVRPAVGGTTSGGTGIRVLAEKDAQAWVERYANEKYKAIFGLPPGSTARKENTKHRNRG